MLVSQLQTISDHHVSDEVIPDHHLKQHLVNIILSGRLSQDEYERLLATLNVQAAAHPQQMTLIECILDDIRAGLISIF